MKRAAMVLGALVFAGAAVWWIVDLFTTDEARVRAAIDGLVDRIESREAISFAEYLSESYRDRWGHDKVMARALVFHACRRFKTIEIDYSEVEVTVEGDKAVARFEARARVQTSLESPEVPLETILPELRNPRYVFTLAKEDGTWLVVRLDRPKANEK